MSYRDHVTASLSLIALLLAASAAESGHLRSDAAGAGEVSTAFTAAPARAHAAGEDQPPVAGEEQEDENTPDDVPS